MGELSANFHWRFSPVSWFFASHLWCQRKERHDLLFQHTAVNVVFPGGGPFVADDPHEPAGFGHFALQVDAGDGVPPDATLPRLVTDAAAPRSPSPR